jgi:hypothetical protein
MPVPNRNRTRALVSVALAVAALLAWSGVAGAHEGHRHVHRAPTPHRHHHRRARRRARGAHNDSFDLTGPTLGEATEGIEALPEEAEEVPGAEPWEALEAAEARCGCELELVTEADGTERLAPAS